MKVNDWNQLSEKYLKRGICVIPVKGKVPQVENWQRWCSELMEEPITTQGQTGIGVCLGPASNLVAVDIDTDDPKVLEKIPPSPVRRRGKKGEVRFFKYSENIQSRTYREIAIEILSRGRQAVIPPSIHPETGEEYTWIEGDLLTFDLDHLPVLDLKFLDSLGDVRVDIQDVGGRHNKLKNISIAMLTRGESLEIVGKEIYEFDKNFHDPRWFTDQSEKWRAKDEREAEAYAFQFALEMAVSLCRNKVLPVKSDSIPANHSKSDRGYRLESLKQLFNEPATEYTDLVEGMFQLPGSSILAARPKLGKSTLARYCAHAVATGENFLGRKTFKGTVIYLCFEDRKDKVAEHFQSMGTSEEAPIFIHAFPVPENAIAKLRLEVIKHKPVLVMVDTLFKLTKVADGNDYALNVQALTPLTDMARELNFHMMFVHHSRKEEGTHGDGILGSVAVFGGIDTAVQLRLTDGKYTVHTIQRYGTSLPVTIIRLNENRTLSLVESAEEASFDEIKKKILELLGRSNEPLNEKALLSQIEGRSTSKNQALQELKSSKAIHWTGSGTKGSPFLYSILPPDKEPVDGKDNLSNHSKTEPKKSKIKKASKVGVKASKLGDIYGQPQAENKESEQHK